MKNECPKSKPRVTEDEVIFSEVCDIICNFLPQIDKSGLKGSTRLDELGFDSILSINLILSLEDIVKKDVSEIIQEIDLQKMNTLDDIKELIIRLR